MKRQRERDYLNDSTSDKSSKTDQIRQPRRNKIDFGAEEAVIDTSTFQSTVKKNKKGRTGTATSS